jgi:hypothetical protein
MRLNAGHALRFARTHGARGHVDDDHDDHHDHVTKLERRSRARGWRDPGSRANGADRVAAPVCGRKLLG